MKKPTVLDIIQYTGTGESFEKIDDYVNGNLYVERNIVYIKTSSNNYEKVEIGDYVIKYTDGTIHVCKKDKFASTYEIFL